MVETIFLVRHGESEANVKKYFAGWEDSPLTKLGRQQALVLKKRISHEKIGRAFCSDLSRARDTLSALSLSCPVEYTSALREKNYGNLERVYWGGDEAAYLPHHYDAHVRAPGGESAEEMQKRTVEYFEKNVFSASEEKVLVVAHHGPLVSLTCSVLGMPLENWRHLRLGNCGLSILTRENGIWRLKLWNSLSHYGLENFGALFAGENPKRAAAKAKEHL